MRRLLFLLLLFFSPLMAFGQGQYFPARTVTGTVNGITRPIAGATVTVCPASTGGIPCSPALANTVFQDSGLSVPLANPFTTDSNGNYPQAALAPGIYTVTESAFGYAGYSYQITVPISEIVSGNLSPLFTTAVTTPTTTPTLSFTASSFAGHRWYGNNTGSTATPGAEQPSCADLSDAAAPCNTKPTIDAQGGTGTLTGNGADQTLWTKTIAANSIPSGGCITFKAFVNSPSTSAVTYKVFLGSATVINSSIGATAVVVPFDGYICNIGGTGSQTFGYSSFTSSMVPFAVTGTSSIDTTTSQILKMTFNTANPNTSAGLLWSVRY